MSGGEHERDWLKQQLAQERNHELERLGRTHEALRVEFELLYSRCDTYYEEYRRTLRKLDKVNKLYRSGMGSGEHHIEFRKLYEQEVSLREMAQSARLLGKYIYQRAKEIELEREHLLKELSAIPISYRQSSSDDGNIRISSTANDGAYPNLSG